MPKLSIWMNVVWLAVVGVAIYGTITGTNWYRNYHEALGRAESVSNLEVQVQSLSGTIEEKDAEITRLKAIPLR